MLEVWCKMTLEETSEILKSIKLNGGLTDKDRQALNVVIQMLETGEVYMTGEDYNLYIEGYKAGLGTYKQIEEENERLKKDQRPQGEWEILKGDFRTGGGDPLLVCPFCHSEKSIHLGGIECPIDWSFCPNCGASLKKG